MRLPKLMEWPKGETDVLVSRSLISVETEEAIERLLKFDNPKFFKAKNSGLDVTDVPRYILAYQKYASAYRLPRHAPFQKLALRLPHLTYPVTETLPWEFRGTMREEQIPAWAAIEHQLIYRKDGILVLSCGTGKTVLATKAFTWRKQPTLVVVTQLPIGRQWKRALLEFTDISEDRIGLIGEGYAEWDRDFVVGTIQTLAKKDFPWQFYRRFGLVFYDECHRLGAQYFGRVAPMFTGQRIGLTATLERTDKMEQLFMLHLGKVFYEDKRQQLIPKIYFERTPAKKNVKGFRWGGSELNISKIVTHLSKLDYRQEWIVEKIIEARTKDRKILVLSDRKDELVSLHEQLKGLHQNSGICVGSLPVKIKCNKKVARKMTQEQREAALREPVVLATSQLVKEGLDQKDIDTLFILYPLSSPTFAEQASGRILRLDDDKRPPVVMVLVDAGVYDGHRENQPFTVKARKMETTFKRLGYRIMRGVDEAAA